MTQRTPTAMGTQITTLAADNTTGNISAADLRSLMQDLTDSTYFLNTNTTADVVGGDLVLSNGKAIKTDTTTAHTGLIQAYDVDGTAYKTFATLTNANVPSLAIAAPSGGTITIDGSSIGSITPLDGAFTTLSTTGAITGGSSSNIAINTNKFTVTASSGNTLVAGTLNVTGAFAINTSSFTVDASGNTVNGGTLTVTGNTTFTGYELKSVNNAVSAAGSTRTDATQLAKAVNNITTVGSGTGVILPVGVVGMTITVFNNGSNVLKVYASASETIDGVAGATGVSLTNTKRCQYLFTAANTWISAQLGVVSA